MMVIVAGTFVSALCVVYWDAIARVALVAFVLVSYALILVTAAADVLH